MSQNLYEIMENFAYCAVILSECHAADAPARTAGMESSRVFCCRGGAGAGSRDCVGSTISSSSLGPRCPSRCCGATRRQRPDPHDLTVPRGATMKLANRALAIAILIGTALQVIMVTLGHST